MKVLAVIPARWASSRYPGKPLADIGGKPLLQAVYEQTLLCRSISSVLIATDDERILKAAQSFGAQAVMTSTECASGTDRVAQAIRGIEADAVINIQGDQVLFDKTALTDMVNELEKGWRACTETPHGSAEA